jgi:hypothetical protein
MPTSSCRDPRARGGLLLHLPINSCAGFIMDLATLRDSVYRMHPKLTSAVCRGTRLMDSNEIHAHGFPECLICGQLATRRIPQKSRVEEASEETTPIGDTLVQSPFTRPGTSSVHLEEMERDGRRCGILSAAPSLFTFGERTPAGFCRLLNDFQVLTCAYGPSSERIPLVSSSSRTRRLLLAYTEPPRVWRNGRADGGGVDTSASNMGRNCNPGECRAVADLGRQYNAAEPFRSTSIRLDPCEVCPAR